MPPGVAAQIGRLLERIGRVTRGLQYAEGLNPAQWESLRFLSLANRRSRTPTALAVFLGTTKGTASQTLLALEGKGLVRRQPAPDDRRATLLELTPTGAALLDADPIRELEQEIGGLSCEVQVALAGALALLLHRFVARSGLREFGVCGRCGHFESGCDDGPSRCAYFSEPLAAADETRLCLDYLARPGTQPKG